MAENKQIPPQFDLSAKWDACLDLTVRRFVYSSLAGAFGGLLLFRSPVTRWASVAFGAGIGIGSAYIECSKQFDGSTTKWMLPSKISHTPQFIKKDQAQVASNCKTANRIPVESLKRMNRTEMRLLK
ncbi:hypothetical protein HHK36_009163 [Tetracentron sinense]|uniref:MICOS complex subunit MIC10 n=1 Tax=Tetracentron sinense TaxID=13715 RepID=A0A835DI49_TETSI|nr:hypothetical protein HHK36_009163 [Tetracentron sinense]